MLLSLRKRHTIALSPTHIAVMQTPRGWRPRALAPETFACELVDGEPAWRAPLETLRRWLEKNGNGQTGMRTKIILSDLFACYALIPWSDDVHQDAEVLTMSRMHFETLYGEQAKQWHIETDISAFGEAAVSCAIDSALIAALREILTAGGCELVSLRPYFMCVINRWRYQIQDDALLLVLEAGQCVVAMRKAGMWHSVRGIRLNHDVAEGVGRLIDREALLQGLDANAAIYVHAPTSLKDVAIKTSREITMLDAPSLGVTRVVAMGMLLCGEVV